MRVEIRIERNWLLAAIYCVVIRIPYFSRLVYADKTGVSRFKNVAELVHLILNPEAHVTPVIFLEMHDLVRKERNQTSVCGGSKHHPITDVTHQLLVGYRVNRKQATKIVEIWVRLTHDRPNDRAR